MSSSADLLMKAVTFILISGFIAVLWVMMAMAMIAAGVDGSGIILLAIPLGLIPGYIAHSKGRSFLLWWLYGAAIFIVALPHSIVMDHRGDRSGERKKCLFCESVTYAGATTCDTCGRDI